MFRTLDKVDVKGKRVLVRVDLNLPMGDGKVTDDPGVRAVAPTIREIADKGGKVILLAHFGRPKGGPEEKFSLKQIVPAVSSALGRPVGFAGDCIGAEAEAAVAAMKDGEGLLLENTRVHKGGGKTAAGFTAPLAKRGEVCVNDGYSGEHRPHSRAE